MCLAFLVLELTGDFNSSNFSAAKSALPFAVLRVALIVAFKMCGNSACS